MNTPRLIFIFVVLFIFGCSTNTDSNNTPPIIRIAPEAPSNLTGIVVSTTKIKLSWIDNATNETGFKIERKTATGAFAIIESTPTDITTFSDIGLTPNTTYTYRIRSYNLVGTSIDYSNLLTLNTSNPTTLPTVTTTATSAIGTNSASSGGTISSDGGASITARGVVWNTSPSPTIALPTKTNNGAGTGVFISTITGLTANTTYYLRAYATNSAGTAYGNENSFTTTVIILPVVTTNAIIDISAATASSGGTVSSDGGALVTARGVVWSTSANPTIALSTKTNNGTGTGSFTSTIAGLSANTNYYARAYATNSIGTAYGSELSFMTQVINVTGPSVTDIEGHIYQTVTNCNQTWTKTNLIVSKYRNGDVIPEVTDPTEWANLTTGAWCYFANTTLNGTTYGKLYNWYAVTDSRGLAPEGYHIPSDTEWTTFTSCLGGETIAGGKIKETGTAHWETPNTGATNESGFKALPGGYRYDNGTFSTTGFFGYWWSSSNNFSNIAWDRYLYYNYGDIYRNSFNKAAGFSVRCIKD